MPHAQPPHLARTSAALPAVALARPGADGLLALILVLLLRLLARTEAAWFLSQDDEDEYEEEEEEEYEFDAYAICGADPYALYPRAVGRAPHAIYVEAGLVADWILAGVRNRGMRPHAMPPLRPRRTLRARAPPPAIRPKLKTPSDSGASTHAHFHNDIGSIDEPPY